MLKRTLPLIGLIFLCLVESIAQENAWTSSRPDGHAPISVMGDHYHKKGEFMFSYRLMSMQMEGNLSGSNSIENREVFSQFMVSPQSMQMHMHMLGAMYAPADWVSLMVMGNYLSNTMDLQMRNGVSFQTESSGIGDISVGGIFKILNKNRQSLHSTASISIPTGDIDQRGNTPMMDNIQLAYPMQLGTGTFDPTVGLTYLGQTDRFSWGVQSKYTFRLGSNDEDYTFGNRFGSSAWAAIRASNLISFSSSLSYFNTEQIEGFDADLNPMMMPLFDAANSGRSQLDFGIGTNISISKGTFKNLRFGFEIKLPVYQEVTGIQMQNGLSATLGIQYAL